MSRSYREPYYVDSYGSKVKKLTKREANKVVRKNWNIDDGCMYRKVYDPWNIVDYRYRWSPWLRYYMNWEGEMDVINPEPYYKVGRK
jgi:hypothetical protein